jgi:hypothetical protein
MMRSPSRSTRKSLPQINHRGYELCKEAEKVFIQTKDPDKKLDALQILEKSRFWRSSSNIATIGAMLIELSGSQAYSPDDRIGFISRANEYLEKATANEPYGRNQSIFRARQLLANISIFQAAAVDLPPSRRGVDIAISKTIEISKQALSDESYLRQRDNNEYAIKQAKGTTFVKQLSRWGAVACSAGAWVRDYKASLNFYLSDKPISCSPRAVKR